MPDQGYESAAEQRDRIRRQLRDRRDVVAALLATLHNAAEMLRWIAEDATTLDAARILARATLDQIESDLGKVDRR